MIGILNLFACLAIDKGMTKTCSQSAGLLFLSLILGKIADCSLGHIIIRISVLLPDFFAKIPRPKFYFKLKLFFIEKLSLIW